MHTHKSINQQETTHKQNKSNHEQHDVQHQALQLTLHTHYQTFYQEHAIKHPPPDFDSMHKQALHDCTQLNHHAQTTVSPPIFTLKFGIKPSTPHTMQLRWIWASGLILAVLIVGFIFRQQLLDTSPSLVVSPSTAKTEKLPLATQLHSSKITQIDIEWDQDFLTEEDDFSWLLHAEWSPDPS